MNTLYGKRIINNIYAKAKELNIKIGDIEKNVPVSLGYFSRFLKDDNHSLPSLDSLYVAADKLGVTIDYLLSSNYSEMNEEELLLQEKTSALIIGTNDENYCWNEIKEKDFYKPIFPNIDNKFCKRQPFVTFDEHYNLDGIDSSNVLDIIE